MEMIQVWGYNIPKTLLKQVEINYLNGLPNRLPSVEWVWQELDRIWYEQKLDNKLPLSKQLIANYYAHPVWLMNGIFTELDPVSASHRYAIATYLKQIQIKSIADFGGGFGALALAIAKTIPDVSISIVEPYPSKVGLERINIVPIINIVPTLYSEEYDVVIAQDVLEHIEAPIDLAFHLANATRVGGRLIFANCFYPVIECHLPSTFHLRHTFPWIMTILGLRYLGTIDGAKHAQIFEKSNKLSLNNARIAETVSRLICPIVNLAFKIKRFTKRMLEPL